MRALDYLKMLRPAQWLKNLMLLFPSFLGGTILQAGFAGKAVIPMAVFCLASGSSYIINDILDAENDSYHQTKKHRPIASGAISRSAALIFAAFILLTSIALGYAVSNTFIFLVLLYLSVSISYSIKLKEYPIIDIFCISAGFLFRLNAGGEAFRVAISEWLFLSVFLLSIFLSTGKRLCEKNMLGLQAGSHRKSLHGYPAGFLEGTMYMTGAAVLVTYTMYAIQRHLLVYTVPLCTFGLLRYIFRVNTGKSGDPTESLLKDPALFCVGLLWAVWIGITLYG